MSKLTRPPFLSIYFNWMKDFSHWTFRFSVIRVLITGSVYFGEETSADNSASGKNLLNDDH